MIARLGASLVAALLLIGCASTQLNYNTLDLASSTEDLVTKQVLHNFASFIDDPAAIPAQVTVSSGIASTSNSITPTITAPLNTGVTTARLFAVAPTRTVTDALTSDALSVAASDSWNQSWSYAPVTDPERMKRLQALYRYAVDWSDKVNGADEFVKNFPPIQRSVSISRPLCIKKKDNKTDMEFNPDGSKKEDAICATAAANPGVDKLSRGATTESYSNQQDDPYYLRNLDCILCLRGGVKTINENIAGPWLRWQSLAGATVDPVRAPKVGDVSLGRSGHYEFFTSPRHAQKFVNFTVATLAAMSQAGSTGSGATGGAPQVSGGAPTKNILGVNNTTGEIVPFTVIPGQ